MIFARRLRCLALTLICVAPLVACADDIEQQLLEARLQQLTAAGEDIQALTAPDVVAALYEQRGNTLLWDEARRRSLVESLSRSDLEGLSPADYNASALASLPALDSLSAEARVDADLALTDAFLRYLYHMRFGKVDAASYDATWNFPRRVQLEDPIAAIAQTFSAGDFAQALAAYAPKSSLYSGLKAQLTRYRTIAANGGWPDVASTPVLKPGMTDPNVVLLRKRLAAEGYAVADVDSPNYDAPLEAIVREYQRLNGLGADGAIGARSVAALNVPVQARIDQIRVNLERLRWIERARTKRFIAVNIAGFEAHLIEDGRSIWSARVMVGKPYRQTPTFIADMKYIVFNPDWTVPPTILRQDVLPALRKNPGYLAEKHMEVLDRSGKRIDPATIDWTRYPPERFPYMIRQVPGPWNSLGRVKFIFPNPEFVFLHDTPARELFDKPERTFSSGCIRLEHPFEFAQLLLPGWDMARIDEVLATATPKTVFLPQPVPVLLVYLTSLALQDGTMRFYRDIYSSDGRVLDALNAGFVYRAPEGLPVR